MVFFMCKKGFAERIPGTVEETIVKNGEEVKKEKEIKFIKLTEAGYNFDPDAKAVILIFLHLNLFLFNSERTTFLSSFSIIIIT